MSIKHNVYTYFLLSMFTYECVKRALNITYSRFLLSSIYKLWASNSYILNVQKPLIKHKISVIFHHQLVIISSFLHSTQSLVRSQNCEYSNDEFILVAPFGKQSTQQKKRDKKRKIVKYLYKVHEWQKKKKNKIKGTSRFLLAPLAQRRAPLHTMSNSISI